MSSERSDVYEYDMYGNYSTNPHTCISINIGQRFNVREIVLLGRSVAELRFLGLRPPFRDDVGEQIRNGPPGAGMGPVVRQARTWPTLRLEGSDIGWRLDEPFVNSKGLPSLD